MNKTSPWSSTSKLLFGIALKCRRILPRRKCQAFGVSNSENKPKIERVYVINLQRQPTRLNEIKNELKQILDSSGNHLCNITERFSAVDAHNFSQDPITDENISPFYTLNDQLFVEPQPLSLPTQMELDATIQMSRPEIAVALSHIGVWQQFITSNNEYALILEDDVWFRPGFSQNLNQAWSEICLENETNGNFDILYLSYEEVKNGAPKTSISRMVFRPERGLWNLSGYVISRKGAEKLLQLLPCRGPIDLWINHQFKFLDVRAVKKSIINQRPDFNSTNSYSILPSLTKIGAITSEGAALFQSRPRETPVFAFGSKDSGLTSLAMALSMLGYRCCSDLQQLPQLEFDILLSGRNDRIFDAYVNIGSLESNARTIKELYPNAKFILSTNKTSILNDLEGADVLVVEIDYLNKWRSICEHLRCAPPSSPFPELSDIGQREIIATSVRTNTQLNFEIPIRDKSPWVIEPNPLWQGIQCIPRESELQGLKQNSFDDDFKLIDTRNWYLREDTFTDNMALFRSSNVELLPNNGIKLNLKKESLGVREYSAGALTSNVQYLYGRFEANIKASNASGVLTGFFLHRDSPRQEIDIEIAGNRPDRMLVNVFYNPGGEGAKFDYGYRGAATYIDLGFDASEDYHKYTIEWDPNNIRWFVDNRLVHTRSNWNPTPIPNLPMSLHANVWPCRSKELAGRLNNRRFPTITFIKSIKVEANQQKNSTSL